MNVVDFNAFKASRASGLMSSKSPIRSRKGAPGRQSLAFEGQHDEVVDAVLAWLEEADQYGPVELILNSETVMLIRKGSVEFIESYRYSGPNEWYKRLPRNEAMWWELDQDACICHAGVLVAIVTEYRDAIAELLRDGIGKDSWRSNPFVVAMDGDKDEYYSNPRRY